MRRPVSLAFLVTLLCAISVPLMATGAKEAAGPTTVSLGYSGGVWIEKYFDQVIGSLAQSMPNLTVKKVVYPTYDDLLNGLPAQVAAKTNPDVLYWTNEQLADYVSNGVLAPLDRLLPPAKIDLGVFYKGLVQGWTMNGKLYGVPFNGQNSAMVVNLDLLKQAGVTELPKTIQELGQDATLIQTKTGSTGLVILDNLFHLSQYVYAFGGGWGNGRTINSPQNAQGLQFLVDLFTKDKAAATAKQLGAAWDGEAFAKGTVGFSTGGPWYIGYMQQAGPNVHYQLMPIPTATGGTAMVTYGGGLSVFANVKDPGPAMQLIAYLTDDTNMKLMATSGLKYLPARTAYMDLYVSIVPEFAPLKEAFFTGTGLDYPPGIKEFGDDLVKGFEQMVFQPGSLTPQDLLATLQQKYGK
ncbi:MAG TPA: extracellular solute-binding protein [Candidatus Sulfotelmatobacter sp.]|nr:extracellular solute-binding protein [Candidatus Sulfotelmatobacter sp.]